MSISETWRVTGMLALVLLASACGGGDDEEEDEDEPDPPVNPADAAGLWQGTASVAGSSVPYVFRALVTPDGRMRLGISSLDAPPTLAPTIIDATLDGRIGTLELRPGSYYSLSVAPPTGTATGMLDGEPRSRVTGSVNFGGRTYNLDGVFNPEYDNDSSLATIAGVYTRTSTGTGGSFTLTVTIEANGNLSGSDTRGCLMTGTVQADLPTINAYAFTWNATNCPGVGLNGNFAGRLSLLNSPMVPGARVLAFFAHSNAYPIPPYEPLR